MRLVPPSVLRVALAAALLAASARGVVGQQGCNFIEGSGNLQTTDYGQGAVTYVHTPNLSCKDGVRIRADSAVAFQASNYVQLIGHVRFEDPDRRLTSQNAEYFSTVGRLQAHIGAQLLQKGDSSTVEGAEMIYNRADKDRARAQLDVFGDRPHARLHVHPDSTSGKPDTVTAPYDVIGDRILIETDSYFRARGDVTITRNDLHANADSVEYDQVAGTLRLMSRAHMRIQDRDLSADLIDAQLPGDEVREVVARRHAELVSQDIRLRSPLMHVFFDQGQMQRLVAVPLTAASAAVDGARATAPKPPAGASAAPGAPSGAPPNATASAAPPPSDDGKARPVATSQDFTIIADSLDVAAPASVLDRIHAVGRAHAESTARDSLNTPDTPKIARTDWIDGDTIVAKFAKVDSTTAKPAAPSQGAASRPSRTAPPKPQPARPAAPAAQTGAPTAAQPDSAKPRYRIEELSAAGKARTLYRMEPADSAKARGERSPSIHYVSAASIVLHWNEGEIKEMEVHGQTEGVHVEPTPVKPDSAKAKADSARARGDTTRAAPQPAPLRGGGTVRESRAERPEAPTLVALPAGEPAKRRRRGRRSRA